MNLKQLEAFREVMVAGSVSAAARNLLRTQPAISAMIRGLEHDLGYPLFVRSGGRLLPKPEARYLFEEVDSILARLTEVERNMIRLRDLEHGTLNIVAMPGPSVVLLPDLIGRFVVAREEVDVSLMTRSSPQVLQMLSSQLYDLGVADLGAVVPESGTLVEQQALASDCVCAMRDDDPLTQRTVVHPRDLSGKPMAALYAEHQTHRDTQAAFAADDAAWTVRFETQYFLPLLRFVERGLAYAVIDRLSAKSYGLLRGGESRLAFRRFEPAVAFRLSLITPKHRPVSSLAGAFTDFVKAEIIALGGAAG